MTETPDSPAAARLTPGDVVAERYRIDAILGEGGMGLVYRAEHLHLRKPFALKVLLPEWSSTAEVVARFEREAVAAGNIQSPNVAAATDFGRLPDGSFFLVMEYVSGRTLRAELERGALPAHRALRVAAGMAAGLRAAHALGIVHRDLKPENVMLVERDGDPDFVKILDFGIAKVDADGSVTAGAPLLTRAGAVIGTPDYMPPEQALGQTVDARSDLYSLGVVLHEMLTGRPPFEGGALTLLRQHVMSDVPELPAPVLVGLDPRVVALLRGLLAKSPDNRIAGAAELCAALDELLAVRPSVVVVAPTPPARRLPAFLERASPRQLATGAGTAVLLMLLLLLATWRLATPNARAGTTPGAPGTAPDEDAAASAEELSPPVPVLPPPPSPTTTAVTASPSAPASAAPSSRPARRTGPGGIYIPPPSTWFR